MKSLVRSLRNLGVGAGLLLCGGLVANPALADTITYDFVGTVTSVGPNLPQNEFSVGQDMKGSITVATRDRNSHDKNNGRYVIEDFTVTISDFTATMAGSCGQVQIRNGSELDRFRVRVYCLVGEDPDEILPENPQFFALSLRGQNHIFSSDALPGSIPDVSAFTERNQFRLVFEGPGRAVKGVVKSLTVAPSPQQ